MYYLFKRDTILATLSVFLVMGLLTLIPLNLHVLDPLKLALTDISFNDLSFSALKSHRENGIDDKMVIVNIGSADRKEIAAVIKRINESKPKVIGLDVLFPAPGVPVVDSVMAMTIVQTPNIVLGNKLDFSGDTLSHANYFQSYSKYSGYVNLVGETAGVIRYFSPFEKWKDSEYNSFAAAVVQQSDELRFSSLKKRKNDLEVINYRRQADQFFVIDFNDLLINKVSPTIFNNKIVLIGFVDNNPSDIEDKHFTPLNEKFVGKSIPDMNGVIIHANIISMILDQAFIKKSPGWFNWFLAILINWIFMAFIIKYYIERHIWFHLSAKITQLFLSVAFIYLGIVLGKYFNANLSFTAMLAGIVLSVDVLYFYEGFANWANKKFGFNNLFLKVHKH